MISQARVLKQMLQLHFPLAFGAERSRVQVKVIRWQWQEPV